MKLMDSSKFRIKMNFADGDIIKSSEKISLS